MPRACIVLNCKNAGPLCRPCYEFLTTGRANGSAAYHLARAAARPVYDALAIITGAADSWHTFHQHTQIQCDDICAALPAATEALETYEAYEREARHV
jgi:hypothetical protein